MGDSLSYLDNLLIARLLITRYDSHIITLVGYYAFSINNDLEMTQAVKRIELCLNDVDKWMRIKQQTETRQRKDRAPLYSFKIQTTATFTVNLLSRRY